MVGVGLVGEMVLDDCIWTEQERLPTPCCASPDPPSPTCRASLPFVGPEVPLCCRNAGLASGCLLPGVERTEERRPPAACRHTSCRLCGLESRPGPSRVLRAPRPPPPSLTVAPPLSSGPWLPFALTVLPGPSLCRLPPACAHCGLFLLTWACPRRHLVLVFEGLVGRRQGDIYGGDQEAFGHPLETPPAAS